MGLTKQAAGHGAIDRGLSLQDNTRVVALAGNPNVGKSTVFNALTGLHQHTGNWPGKTVTNAQGLCRLGAECIQLVDIPGTYSLMAHSTEEEVARDFICFSYPDAVIVVCDATCLERNLNLVLQILETGARVLVCVNLIDEAQRKHISIDTELLEKRLGVPVVATVARKRKTLNTLLTRLNDILNRPPNPSQVSICYPRPIERAVTALETLLTGVKSSRWLALRLLEDDPSLREALHTILCKHPQYDAILSAATAERARLAALGLHGDGWRDHLVHSLVDTAHALCNDVVRTTGTATNGYATRDRRIDRLLTGRIVGYPAMLLLLMGIFWLTIEGANVPSAWLSTGLFWLQDRLSDLFTLLHAPPWLHDILVLGVYRTLAWVVSVMLPPMALFFPLFTLLEDVGYLPRIAYNLDRPFARCRACGKQALTMCMGFGCNAAGVVGARIIDSPRERLLAILTNNFVPCNGRFPTILTLLTVFFIGTTGSSFLAAALLTGVILLGIITTLGITKLLSATILRGTPSSFTLELPPYRRPQLGQVLVRSVLDRTLFVLGRAAAVAAPAGLIIWCMANITVGGVTLLTHCADFLTPLGQLMGLDGVILLAFILGFPANEIVLPIILMGYLAQGSLIEFSSVADLRDILISNGWTPLTAICTILFSLFHWPCSTTLLTIRKETRSTKWTLLAAALPTAVGITVCIVITTIAHLLS